MSNAIDFFALFMLHMVIAGKGIDVRDVGVGERLMMTGFMVHL